MQLGVDVEHHDRRGDGVRLHVVEAGPRGGQPVLLLHGFPECWACWRYQIAPLAAAGLRVIVPDQRGYNLSDRPPSLGAYRLDRLTRDAVALLDDVGVDRTVVVGHDWGGMVAWWLAITEPQRVSALVACNIPHPVVMRRFMWRDPAQRRRSWYIYFFQLPLLPELWLGRHGFRVLRRMLRGTSRRGTFDDDILEVYRGSWSRPGALTSMLAWYRAALRRPLGTPERAEVVAPTTIVWGARDRALGVDMVAPSLALCRGGRSRIVDDATHWIQHEEPELVTRTILDAASVG
jgi:pimeloyl-ACP methyl ester carboxylesterase